MTVNFNDNSGGINFDENNGVVLLSGHFEISTNGTFFR